ncbi:hypothetical protein CRV00_05535 [Malaciobacter molluscorum]|uniref:hypothetical protein n=1 Tax=Malaciobacter molluscorum TaxID=1032072 RepID=UPI00100A4E74|nr:hypothetical protein [Malaciobacter molluscorum]RXJ94793.1 hypothetical protein CRV00_05535 [Malaciobacter molluscorum]
MQKNIVCSSSKKYYQFIPKLNNFLKNPNTLKNNEIVDFLKSYYECLLYYEKNNIKKGLLNYNNEILVSIFKVKVNNNYYKADIRDIGISFTHTILEKFRKAILINEKLDFEKLNSLIYSIFKSNDISDIQKFKLLWNEDQVFNIDWNVLLLSIEDKDAINTIQIKLDFIIKVLEKPQKFFNNSEINDFISHSEINDFIKTINYIYIKLIYTLLKIHMAKNHFVEIFVTIDSNLDRLDKETNIEKKWIIFFLLEELILNNNLFHFRTKEEIENTLYKYENSMEKTEFDKLVTSVNFDITKYNIKRVDADLGLLNLINYNDNSISTEISFVILHKVEEDKEYIIEGKNKINFNTITSLFDDPIFITLDLSERQLNGAPSTFYADSIGNIGNSTKITITIDEFYHPDFNIENGKIIFNSFEIEEAKHGGRYYPYKDYIIDILFNLNNYPKGFEKKHINSDLISNFLVTYNSKNNNEFIAGKVHLLTNKDSFEQLKNNFLNKKSELYLKDDFLSIRDLIYEYKITDERSFLDFCYKLLVLTIKKSIEFNDLEKYLWDNGKPAFEPKAQILLFNYVKDFAEFKGVKMIREASAASGNVDFYFHYTYNNKSLSTCVELKNAQHKDILHGIEVQLPLYMKSIGGRRGIFLVLWYKSENFTDPKKYNSISELEKDLKKKIPNNMDIKILTIDCTIKGNPSKKISSSRI